MFTYCCRMSDTKTIHFHKMRNQVLGFNAKHLTFTLKKVIYILELQTIKIHNEQNHFTMNIIFPLHQPREECDIIYSFSQEEESEKHTNFVTIFTVWYTVKNVIYMQQSTLLTLKKKKKHFFLGGGFKVVFQKFQLHCIHYK